MDDVIMAKPMLSDSGPSHSYQTSSSSFVKPWQSIIYFKTRGQSSCMLTNEFIYTDMHHKRDPIPWILNRDGCESKSGCFLRLSYPYRLSRNCLPHRWF